MGGRGEDIVAGESKSNTRRGIVSAVYSIFDLWDHRAICHEGGVAIANTQ